MGIGIYWLQGSRSRRERRGIDASPTPMDEAMMREALAQADLATRAGEVPVGAVVYRLDTGEVVARAHNRRESDRDPASHAEFSAVAQACRALDDWRLNDFGVAVTLEPCPMCAGLMVNARVGRLVYGCADPKAGAVRSLFRLADDARLNHRCTIVPCVLAGECGEVLSRFFKGLRSKKRGAGGAKNRRHGG